MTHYTKGANFERQIIKDAEQKGAIAFRSAGSHSEIDVIVIWPWIGEIHFIQAKRGKKVPPSQAFKNLKIPIKLTAKKIWVTKEDHKEIKTQVIQ